MSRYREATALQCYPTEVTAVSPCRGHCHCSIILTCSRWRSVHSQHRPHWSLLVGGSRRTCRAKCWHYCSTAALQYKWGDTTSSCSPPPWRPCCSRCAGRGSPRSARSSAKITARAANEPSEKFSQSRRKPSPDWKRVLALPHLGRLSVSHL